MKVFVILLSMSIIAGCTSALQNIRKVNPGMSPEEVDEIMGPRDSFTISESKGDTFTLYRYTNQPCNTNVGTREKCYILVIFKNDKVVETGIREVRAKKPNYFEYLKLFKD